MSWLISIPRRIALAGALLSLMLIGGVAMNAQAVASGREIVVRAQGFDPRDFLAGHYVRLAYDFSSPIVTSPPACHTQKGATVWVRLSDSQTPEGYEVEGIACSRAALKPGGIALKGRSTGYLRLDFGIERFYAEQADAERIEKALRRTWDPNGIEQIPPPVHVVLSVGKDGRARIKALLLGDERIDLSWT